MARLDPGNEQLAMFRAESEWHVRESCRVYIGSDCQAMKDRKLKELRDRNQQLLREYGHYLEAHQ